MLISTQAVRVLNFERTIKMATKQFKAESKKLLDMMINSIYTNKEIFLRELISNASDALDKLYYKSLTDTSIGLNRNDFVIRIDADKDARTLTISDNGCGMDEKELEQNLGTIAKSGSLNFKKENEKKDDVDIIGQFGVGFYSAFMVADEVTVISKPYGSDSAFKWNSKGVAGYTVEPCEKDDFGTTIILHLKEDDEENNYSTYLETYTLKSLVKKYSDYIRHPIQMDVEHYKPRETDENGESAETDENKEPEVVIETETLNSMVPIWKKNKSEVTEEEYNQFYSEKFYDYEKPAKVISSKVEGVVSYNSLLFIPSHAPYDFYTKEYEKGLQLYSSGVMIMEKCSDLLPDYFSFVKGIVDSEDLSLNISREMLQKDAQVKKIATSIEKKIKSELEKMLKNERDEYEKVYKAFGRNLKFGLYSDYGMHRDTLQNLVMFYSSTEKKNITLNEYVERMADSQDTIYYACGETVDKIDMLPQIQAVKDKGFEILYCTEDVDEFCFKMLGNFKEKKFANVCSDKLDLDTETEKEELKNANEDAKDMLDCMKESLNGEVCEVRFTNKLKDHPVCLASEGEITIEMEKVLNRMPGNDQKVKAQIALKINLNHEITEKLKKLYENDDKETLKKYTELLFNQARLIEGLPIENPLEFSKSICELM